jgi:hypothetical protein
MTFSKHQEKIYIVATTLHCINKQLRQEWVKLNKKILKILAEKSCEVHNLPQDEFCEIWLLVAKNKTIEEIRQIFENKEQEPLKEKTRQICKKIIDFSIKYELENDKNQWKSLEEIDIIWSKNAWKRIRIIMKLAKEWNQECDETNAQVNLEMLLSMEWKSLRNWIQNTDIELFLHYIKYYNAKNKKEPEA